MCVAHIFDTVGNHLTGRKGIEHAVMPHGDAVINGNCIEFCSKTSEFFNAGLDFLAYFMKMYVTRDKLSE